MNPIGFIEDYIILPCFEDTGNGLGNPFEAALDMYEKTHWKSIDRWKRECACLKIPLRNVPQRGSR